MSPDIWRRPTGGDTRIRGDADLGPISTFSGSFSLKEACLLGSFRTLSPQGHARLTHTHHDAPLDKQRKPRQRYLHGCVRAFGLLSLIASDFGLRQAGRTSLDLIQAMWKLTTSQTGHCRTQRSARTPTIHHFLAVAHGNVRRRSIFVPSYRGEKYLGKNTDESAIISSQSIRTVDHPMQIHSQKEQPHLRPRLALQPRHAFHHTLAEHCRLSHSTARRSPSLSSNGATFANTSSWYSFSHSRSATVSSDASTRLTWIGHIVRRSKPGREE